MVNPELKEAKYVVMSFYMSMGCELELTDETLCTVSFPGGLGIWDYEETLHKIMSASLEV